MFDCNIDGVKCNRKDKFLRSRVTCKANGKLRRSREALLRELQPDWWVDARIRKAL